jgi:hypothetical protein
MARRYFRRRSRALFGRTVGGFSHGPFSLESGGHFLLEMDPGGNACALLSGFAESVLSRYLRTPATVIHSACVARGQDSCRWTIREPAAAADE